MTFTVCPLIIPPCVHKDEGGRERWLQWLTQVNYRTTELQKLCFLSQPSSAGLKSLLFLIFTMPACERVQVPAKNRGVGRPGAGGSANMLFRWEGRG